MKLTVIIPTFDPEAGRLRRTLGGLDRQTLAFSDWELLVVDNCSPTPISSTDLIPHFSGSFRIVREETPGLSYARRRGILEASTETLVFSDDDNVFDPRYLERALGYLDTHPGVGVAGGKSLPEYQATPPAWYVEGMAPLGCRDLGGEVRIFSATDYLSRRSYPEFAPIGAGMVFRKTAVMSWMESVGRGAVSDRKGKSLSSAGDCDMVLHALDGGWSVAYWPELSLHHLLPETRLSKDYLGAISGAAFRDFVKVLDQHGIRPWSAIPRWTLPIRTWKAWIRNRAWSGPEAYIRWRSAVGNLEGRSSLRP